MPTSSDRSCLGSQVRNPNVFLFIDYLSLTIAAWCQYLNGYDDQNRPIPIDDPLADLLTQQARSGKTDPRPLLSIFEIFGDLGQSPRFVETVADKLSSLHEFGAKGTLVRLPQAQYWHYFYLLENV